MNTSIDLKQEVLVLKDKFLPHFTPQPHSGVQIFGSKMAEEDVRSVKETYELKQAK